MSWLRFIVALLLLLAPGVAFAHESRPAHVEMREVEPELFEVQWRIPMSVPHFNVPAIGMPEHCQAQGQTLRFDQSSAFVRRARFHCAGGLSGHAVSLTYPVLTPSISTLFRLKLSSGVEHAQLLTPQESSWTIPATETASGVAKQYTALGIRHILEGFDHLLFLACLLLIAGTGKRILITVTGFTVAHSFTLAAAALDWVRVPVPPVEAAIALSIVFLAVEIVKDRRDSWTFRYPVAVSSSFGLLHGFGFAAVLSEIGLPHTEVPTALLFFNVGVELGQLFFIGVLIVMFGYGERLYQRLRGKLSKERRVLLARGSAYLVGSVASLWLVERVYGFWG
jgi:hydrogenase/urease accessory protein HupE